MNAIERFVEAQADVYENALAELSRGRKESHWMWFVFPQVSGLGSSDMAKRYAINSLAEARAFLGHELLGKRLIDCSAALLSIQGKSAEEIMGFPDDLKLKSSMTLFAEVAPEVAVFGDVLDKYFAGERDQRTLEIIGSWNSNVV